MLIKFNKITLRIKFERQIITDPEFTLNLGRVKFCNPNISACEYHYNEHGLEYIEYTANRRSPRKRLQKKPRTILFGPCPICMNDSTEGMVRTKCGHCFHGDCLMSWIKTSYSLEHLDIKRPSCPLCRTDIKAPLSKILQHVSYRRADLYDTLCRIATVIGCQHSDLSTAFSEPL
jgi:hypothetical protein